MRWWAFWRRVQYLTGIFLVLLMLGTTVYFSYFYNSPTCFDGRHNGDEEGIDCGGSCARLCGFDVLTPNVLWSRAFKIIDGQYNAVAYIENKNINVGSPEVRYTFRFYDETGLITERSGVTVLPPDSVYPIFEGRVQTEGRHPTQTDIELGETSTWLPAERGREQFVVESRELKNADSRPRLDARITNTAFTEARNVEIIATIFDRSGNALTASRTIVPYFGAQSTESVVFTWPEPIAKTMKSCEVPTDVVLAIDLSGSMNDDGGTPPEPISSVLRAAESFVERLNAKDKIGIVTYATEAALKKTLSEDQNEAGNIIRTLSIAPRDEVGSTNTGDALKISTEELNSVRHNLDARKVLVLLTDGLANAPLDDPEQYAIDAADNLKESNAQIYTIGLGDNVNETFLRTVASSNGHYFRAASANTVDKIYRTITASICEEGPAVIEIIPKTETSFSAIQ